MTMRLGKLGIGRRILTHVECIPFCSEKTRGYTPRR